MEPLGAGGSIQLEFYKLRWEKRTKEKPLCMKHCSRRKHECLTTSVAWLSPELHLNLNLNDFNGPLAKPIREFLRGTVVGNQAADSVEGPYPRNAAPPQFAEVGDNIHFSRRSDHHIIELCFEHIRRRRAVLQIETVYGQEKPIRMKLVHHRFCLRPN